MAEEPGFRVRVPRGVASAILAYHLVGLAVWNMPDSALRSGLWPWFGPYMHGMGLWQGWDMFGPEPLDSNIEIEATVRYRDGSRRVYGFPELGPLGGFAAYQAIPLRKLLIELPRHSWAWEDVARYVARKCDDRPARPVQVALICFYAPLPPPEAGMHRPIPRRTHQLPLGTFRIREADL